MRKSRIIWFILFFPLYMNAQNPKHYQVFEEIKSTLNTLNSFSDEVNDSGWDDASDVKRYFNILQRAVAKINLITENFDEIITDIEKIENKDFTCLDDATKVEVNMILSDLKKLKNTLKKALGDLYDLELIEVSARVREIYLSPSNVGYKRVAVPEIRSYFLSTFNTLKNLYNHLAELSNTKTYFQIDTDYTIPRLQELCN